MGQIWFGPAVGGPKILFVYWDFFIIYAKKIKIKKLEVSTRGESGEGGSNGFDWLVVSGYLGILIGKGVDIGVSMNEGQMDGER